MSISTDNSRTRFCVLTAPGRSAISSIAVVGPAAMDLVGRHFQAANGRLLFDQPVARIVYGRWEGASGEDLVVCRRQADEVEIHCHGGTQAVARIVTALAEAGAEQLDWREWTAARDESQLEAEAQVALASAATLRTATILLDQYHGALRRELEAVRGLLAASRSEEAADRMERLLHLADFGLHLTKPWRVVMGGRPNVGKSTLVNALAGYQRAIEYDQPGTTRDVVSATTALAGWPVELSDTAGLHVTGDEIELAGIALAKERLRQADLVVWLLDATTLAKGAAPSVAGVARQQAEAVAAPWDQSRTLVAVNKCDLAAPPAELESVSHLISASAGTGIPELMEVIVQRLVSEVPQPGAAVPFTARQVELLAHVRDYCRAKRFSAADRAILELLGPTTRQS